jgi:excisionase family DNA binding protein
VTERPLAAAILDLVRPQLEKIVKAEVEERLLSFVPPQPDPWMTTTQAAEYLQLDEEALRKRARRGTIPAHRDDAGRWLFKMEELDASLR